MTVKIAFFGEERCKHSLGAILKIFTKTSRKYWQWSTFLSKAADHQPATF